MQTPPEQQEKKDIVLIIDDDRSCLSLLTLHLQEAGFKVLVAPSAQSAIKSLTKHSPDIILLDVLLPDMDGFELCRFIMQEKDLNIPVVFLTGLADLPQKVKGLELSAADYITKPFYPEEVVVRLQKHLTLKKLRQSVLKKNTQLQREVLERKLAEKALLDSEKCLTTVMNRIDALIYVADMETYELQFINNRMREWFGDITGKICWQVLQKGQSAPCYFCTNKYLAEAGQPAKAYKWEFQNTVTDRWYYIQDQAIPWIDGRLVRLEIATDITSLKNAEAELKKYHDRLEDLVQQRTLELTKAKREWDACFDALQDYVCIIDIQGKIIRANRRMGGQFFPVYGEIKGLDVGKLYFGKFLVDSPLRDVLQGKPIMQWETALPSLQGWFLVSCFPLFGETEQWGAVMVFSDITEHRQAQIKLQQQKEKLNHLTRINTLGELSAALAHELNQPLTAIFCNARAALHLT